VPAPSPAHAPAPAPVSTEASPARPLRKKERTRREVYTAALALFAKRGFESATVEQICDAAGIARATFFTHFPSKSALLFEFHRGIARELAAQLSGPRRSAPEEFRRMVDLFAARWLPHAEVMSAMLREFLATPALVRAADAEAADLRALIEDVVRHGQARGEFSRAVSPRLASTIFLATSAAILSGHVFAEGEFTAEEVREQFLAALLHGLGARPDAPAGRARSARPTVAPASTHRSQRR
jgi:AcrR family transcriptional regulator